MDGCPFRISEDQANDTDKENWKTAPENSFLVLFNNAKQILPNGAAVTTFTGWISGIFVGKIGKAAMVSIGGGLLLLQLAHAKGYIKINESGVKKLIENVSEVGADGKRTRRWLENLAYFVLNPNGLTYAFAAGFLVGIWCS